MRSVCGDLKIAAREAFHEKEKTLSGQSEAKQKKSLMHSAFKISFPHIHRVDPNNYPNQILIRSKQIPVARRPELARPPEVLHVS
jgi:hypothetical protein